MQTTELTVKSLRTKIIIFYLFFLFDVVLNSFLELTFNGTLQGYADDKVGIVLVAYFFLLIENISLKAATFRHNCADFNFFHASLVDIFAALRLNWSRFRAVQISNPHFFPLFLHLSGGKSPANRNIIEIHSKFLCTSLN